jgi:hypothetical protein
MQKKINNIPEKVSLTYRFVIPEMKKTRDAINVNTFNSLILIL